MIGIIYKAYCQTSKKYYIGLTRLKFERRKQDHIKDSFNPKSISYNYHFHKAIRKYGKDDFIWDIIEEVQFKDLKNLIECLNILEIKYIKLYDSYYNGYNSTLGGESPTKELKKITVYSETGEIIKYFNNCHEVSEYFGISESIVWNICGKFLEFLYRDGIRYIIRYSDYNLTLEEINYILSLNYSKLVWVYNDNGECIMKFDSPRDAEKALGLSKGAVSSGCNRKRKCSCIKNTKYIFRYANDVPSLEELLEVQKSLLSKLLVRAIDSSTGEIIGQYNSLAEAARALNINGRHIGECCKGIRKSCGTYNGNPIKWEIIN